jgi:hypothetical protein
MRRAWAAVGATIASVSLVAAAPGAATAHERAGQVRVASARSQHGYRLLGSDGGIFSFGAPFYGSLGAQAAQQQTPGGPAAACPQDMTSVPYCSAIATTPSGNGYYIADPIDGGIVYSFGDAVALADGDQPNAYYAALPDADKPGLAALLPTSSGSGLVVVEDNGDVLSVASGSAPALAAFGQPPPPHVRAVGPAGVPTPVLYVGGALTPTDQGYWVAAADGNLYAFGDAKNYGSAANLDLKAPIIGMAATADGRGYWLLASDGGIFSFGDAHFYGSTGAMTLNAPVVGMAPTPTGGGYWLVASDGGIFSFGDAKFAGSTGGMRLNQPIVAMSAG